MKQFISAHDVTDINALVAKALKYKDNPYTDKQLGFQKRIGFRQDKDLGRCRGQC